MKLRGSLTEKLCREQLLMSWDGIKKGDGGIMRILMERISKVHSAFVLTWTPEQYEDIFTILVNGVCVVSFEVSKINSTVTDYECADVGAYAKSLRYRSAKIQLAVAVDLASRIYE